MIRWTRADVDSLCGLCQQPIGIGEPVFEMSTDRWTKKRCERCVGQAPPDLAPSLPGRVTKPMEPISLGLAVLKRQLGWTR